MVATLLRIFVDEDDRYAGRPLHLAIVEALRAQGFSGATALKGVEGYGASGRLRSARAVETTVGLPILIEVIDEEENMHAFVPALRAMMSSGLITLERLDVIHVVKGGA